MPWVGELYKVAIASFQAVYEHLKVNVMEIGSIMVYIYSVVHIL